MNNNTSNASVSYNDAFLFPLLQSDETFTMTYLADCVDENHPHLFLSALQNVAEARGKRWNELVDSVGLSPQQLSHPEQLSWGSLLELLSQLGFSVQFGRKQAS